MTVIDPTNADRAAWAKDALAVFTARTGDHPDTMHRHDLDCAIGDLITDLLHYAVQQALDAGGILTSACGNFGFELLEEACRTLPDSPLTGARSRPAMPNSHTTSNR